jgi:transcriptional regulator with XRE-family HTH domain
MAQKVTSRSKAPPKLSAQHSAERDQIQAQTRISAVSAGEAAAERFIEEKQLGQRIKRLRLKRSMGLVELGRLTGLSASFLSQLETGRVVPTLRNLARIAMVFSKDFTYFFEREPETLFRVHRRRERIRQPETGANRPTYFFESLGYMVPDRPMDPYLAQFLPTTEAAGEQQKPHVHAGFEFFYMLEGELELRQGEIQVRLEPGDAVYFDSGLPHSYVCLGGRPASALIVTTHQHGPVKAVASGH